MKEYYEEKADTEKTRASQNPSMTKKEMHGTFIEKTKKERLFSLEILRNNKGTKESYSYRFDFLSFILRIKGKMM